MNPSNSRFSLFSWFTEEKTGTGRGYKRLGMVPLGHAAVHSANEILASKWSPSISM